MFLVDMLELCFKKEVLPRGGWSKQTSWALVSTSTLTSAVCLLWLSFGWGDIVYRMQLHTHKE